MIIAELPLSESAEDLYMENIHLNKSLPPYPYFTRLKFRHYAAESMPSFNPKMIKSYMYAEFFKLHGDGSDLRLNCGFDVKL